MELKLFGKSIFEFRKNKVDQLLSLASNQNQESKYLPDFNGFSGWNSSPISSYIALESLSENIAKSDPTKPKEPEIKKEELTPKGVYELKLLNNRGFELNTNPEYVDQQLTDFKDKLGLIKSEEYDMRRGVNEISSMVIRLENRKKYPEVKEFFEQFAYTTTSKIDALVKEHDNLQLGQVAQFIADMPKDAVEVMKEYNKHTAKVCDKQAVFYIIADKKDFKNTTSRRDPILLAQSPFGHFWQILGAWDEEMLFLENL